MNKVAPVRERGLKYACNEQPIDENGRSRKGAWIEIQISLNENLGKYSRSRKGAWIEIVSATTQAALM